MRIAVLTPIPTPYRDPFWLHLSAREDVTLRVRYCASGKADRPWDADWGDALDARVMPGRNLMSWRGPDASCFHNPSVRRELASFEPDVVLVGGYNHLTMIRGMRWARRARVPYVMMSETWQMRSRGLKAWLRNRVVGRVMGRAAGVLTTGSRARGFVAYHAGPDKPCCDIPNVPDIRAIIESRSDAPRASSTARVLFVGRFIHKKRVAQLVDAFSSLPAELLEQAELDLVGDGELRAQLESQVRALGLEARVRFRGFLQPKDVMHAYQRADVFVMPSSETWGVAPIEAAAAGLHVITSDKVGCVDDLKRFQPVASFPFDDVDALRGCLEDRIRVVLRGEPRPEADWHRWTYAALADDLVAFLRQLTR